MTNYVRDAFYDAFAPKKTSDNPLKIMEDLIDQFYEAEHRLELTLGMTPIDVRVCPYTTELPYFDAAVNEDIYEKFQRIYNDLSNLMHEVKEEMK